ncbi:hypothetical protein ACFXGT_20435 [Streptomyces sp. NPDC059352]|uniref:AAA family ATPase n=1 Tax=Streptomyces sp. NPDC059352 TaxID=3346810 RepID=UPI0036829A9C
MLTGQLQGLPVRPYQARPGHARIRLAPVTLLTGLNSSGKSTVLPSLALLRQSYDSGVLMSTDGDADSHGGFLLDGDLVELGTGQDLLHEDFATAEPGGDPLISVAFETAVKETYAWSARYAAEQDVLPITLPVQPEDWEDAPLFSRRFQYLKADRIVPATTYPRSHHQAIGRGFLGSRGEHAVNFLRHHAQDVVPDGPLRHPQAGGHTLLDQVVAWMQELCPGVNLEATEIPGIDSVRLSFGFGSTAGLYSTRRRRPTNVGFGLTYALPIVVACLTAGPGSLILLENPEAHLHPAASPVWRPSSRPLHPPAVSSSSRPTATTCSTGPGSPSSRGGWRPRTPRCTSSGAMGRRGDRHSDGRRGRIALRMARGLQPPHPFRPRPGRIHLRVITEEGRVRIGYIGRKRLPEDVPRKAR